MRYKLAFSYYAFCYYYGFQMMVAVGDA